MTLRLENMCFIAGCGKCGTTTLANLLNAHPAIVLSTPKEPNFYSKDTEYAKGLNYYQSLFKGKDAARVRLDASVCYTLLDTEKKVVERILQTCIKPKFIYIARNPFKRLESVFCEAHHHTHTSKLDLPYDINSAIKYNLKMLFNSLYWRRTEVIRNNFESTDIIYLTLEDLESDQNETVAKCFDFLKIDRQLPLTEAPVRLNKSSAKTYEPILLRSVRKVLDTCDWLPHIINNYLQSKMRRPVSELDFTWDEEMKYFVHIAFREDVKNYLKAAGKSPSFWGSEFL